MPPLPRGACFADVYEVKGIASNNKASFADMCDVHAEESSSVDAVYLCIWLTLALFTVATSDRLRDRGDEGLVHTINVNIFNTVREIFLPWVAWM